MSPPGRTTYFVIPVLNEAPNLARLFGDLAAAVAALPEEEVQVIVVDDGSTDGTGRTASEAGGAHDLETVVLTHERNHGPGYAFGTAFAYLAPRVQPDDLVVTMEGDNTSRAELLNLMIARMNEGHDAVFASPYMYGGGILNTQPLRVMMSHLANTFVKELLGVHGLLTVSSFFRVYRGSTLQRLQRAYGVRVIERVGFESMIEVVMKMMYLGLSISELPMVLDTTHRLGKSKLNVRKTAVGYLLLVSRKREWRARAAQG